MHDTINKKTRGGEGKKQLDGPDVRMIYIKLATTVINRQKLQPREPIFPGFAEIYIIGLR